MLEQYPDVLTVDEVAQILRVSKRMVYTYLQEGALPYFRLKTASGRAMRRIFIPKKALLQYLEATPCPTT